MDNLNSRPLFFYSTMKIFLLLFLYVWYFYLHTFIKLNPNKLHNIKNNLHFTTKGAGTPAASCCKNYKLLSLRGLQNFPSLGKVSLLLAYWINT